MTISLGLRKMLEISSTVQYTIMHVNLDNCIVGNLLVKKFESLDVAEVRVIDFEYSCYNYR
jgi:thiamine kinase-like enzyme